MWRKLKNNSAFVLVENLSAFAMVCVMILVVATTLSALYNHQQKLKNEVALYMALDNLVVSGERYGEGIYNDDMEMGIDSDQVKLHIIQK